MSFCKHRVMDRCKKDDKPCIFNPDCFEPEEERMTNADRINSMTIEEKAEFLSSIAYGRETPWSEPFARKLCDNCQTVHGTYESGVEDDFHECDFTDGKCPHGSDIAWWLQQPAEDNDNDRES